jgi:hypothetical protein
METVAQLLRDEALTRTVHLERDQFARSSFNRFYYAAFLRVRDGLATMSPGWDEMAHAAMPQLLRGSITGKLKMGLAQAKRNEDGDLVSICSCALDAAFDLANLLDQGRMTRVTADYRPDQPVDFSTVPDFSLNEVTVKSARSWRHRADVQMQTIEKAWRQIGA